MGAKITNAISPAVVIFYFLQTTLFNLLQAPGGSSR